MSGLPADEGTFWGKPQLFANRVWRVYRQVAVELGYEQMSSHAEPAANDSPKPSFARIIHEPPATPEKKTMGRPANSQIKVLDAVKGGHTTRAAIRKATGLPPAQVRQSIARMLDGKRLTSNAVLNGEASYDVGPRAAELTGHALCADDGAAVMDAPKPPRGRPSPVGETKNEQKERLARVVRESKKQKLAADDDPVMKLLNDQYAELCSQEAGIAAKKDRITAAIAALRVG